MTFFWSDAFLKAISPEIMKWIFPLHLQSFSVVFARWIIIHVTALLEDTCWFRFTNMDELNGLILFGLYQALIVPLWVAPFTGGLKRHNIILASAFVLIGPTFACWVGHSSLPGINGILIGLLSYALVGFVWMLTQVKFTPDLKLRRLLMILWPVTWPLILYGIIRNCEASMHG
jgi:hypothetical protein